jgi:hypothetical protein
MLRRRLEVVVNTIRYIFVPALVSFFPLCFLDHRAQFGDRGQICVQRRSLLRGVLCRVTQCAYSVYHIYYSRTSPLVVCVRIDLLEQLKKRGYISVLKTSLHHSSPDPSDNSAVLSQWHAHYLENPNSYSLLALRSSHRHQRPYQTV